MKILISAILITLNTLTFAHEGHHIPGSIPPSPNGGKLAEAKHVHNKHKHNHNHSHAKKAEIFFEGLIKDKALSIYPLELDPDTSKVFLQKSLTDFKKTEFVVFDARKKKQVDLKFERKGGNWVADMSGLKGRRYIVEIRTMFNGAKFKAKLQVEK